MPIELGLRLALAQVVRITGVMGAGLMLVWHSAHAGRLVSRLVKTGFSCRLRRLHRAASGRRRFCAGSIHVYYVTCVRCSA